MRSKHDGWTPEEQIETQEQKTEVTMDDLLIEIESLNYSEIGHDQPWRDQVGKELNELLGRAQWSLETDRDNSDFDFSKAVISICKRVEEFDEIQRITHDELLKQQRLAKRNL